MTPVYATEPVQAIGELTNGNSDTCRIPLTQGRVALVDPEDYQRIGHQKWWFQKHYRGDGQGVAVRATHRVIDGRHVLTQYLMHRVIMNAPPGRQVDHINGDSLDNRRENLRLVTSGENHQNRHRPSRSNTGHLNVHREKGEGTFHVRVTARGKAVYERRFHSLDEAIAAAKAARRKHLPFSREARP